MKFFLSILISILLPCSNFAQKPQVLPICTEEHAELGMTISQDGKNIVFQSNKEDGLWKFFISRRKDNGELDTPEYLEILSGRRGIDRSFLGGAFYTYDGKYIYFCTDRSETDETTTSDIAIWFAEIKHGDIQKPKKAKGEFSANNYAGFPCISPDGKTMYYTADDTEAEEAGGNSCFRIMTAELQSDGSWANAKPLPPAINEGCNTYPRIMPDGKTLYFSRWKEGFGYELYSSKLEKGGWQKALPVKELNTVGDEYYLTVSPTQPDKAYFTRSVDTESNDDLYEFKPTKPLYSRTNASKNGKKKKK